MHSRYVGRRLSPGVSLSELSTTLNVLKPKDHREIYELFRTTGGVDVNEVFAVMIVGAAAFLGAKHRGLFDLYDRDGTESLSSSEVVILVGSVVRGLCRVTSGRLPPVPVVEAMTRELFQETDRNHDDVITKTEWLRAVRTNPGARYIFERFSSGWKRRQNAGPEVEIIKPLVKIKPPMTTTKVRSTLAAHPQLVRELKKELKSLREVFDAIDRDGSGEIALSEFVEASQVKHKGHHRLSGVSTSPRDDEFRMFRNCDVNGDGKISWDELVAAMYQKYGKVAINEMRNWDLADVQLHDPGTYRASGLGLKLSESQIHEIKLMFDIYDVDKEGHIPLDDLVRFSFIFFKILVFVGGIDGGFPWPQRSGFINDLYGK